MVPVNNHNTFTQIVKALDANELVYELVTFDNDLRIILLEYGGRVLGPFVGDGGESLFWTPAFLGDPEALREVVTANGANIGGERFWIAPEIQYNVRDRTDLGTYRLPAQIDPGSYQLDRPAPDQWRLRQRMMLNTYNTACGLKTLDLDSRIEPLPDPLRHISAYASLIEGITYAGYGQTVTLSETQHDAILSQTWNLIQLNPGGQVLIPANPCAEATDYSRGEPFEAALTVGAGGFRFPITGQHIFKVGYKAAHVAGRVGYFNRLDGQQAYLLVRAFGNNPSALYGDEPVDRPGWRGDSVQVYNDGGQHGGFGELECFGQAIGQATGLTTTTDTFQLWAYVGAPDRVAAIATHLLGMAPA